MRKPSRRHRPNSGTSAAHCVRGSAAPRHRICGTVPRHSSGRVGSGLVRPLQPLAERGHLGTHLDRFDQFEVEPEADQIARQPLEVIDAQIDAGVVAARSSTPTLGGIRVATSSSSAFTMTTARWA